MAPQLLIEDDDRFRTTLAPALAERHRPLQKPFGLATPLKVIEDRPAASVRGHPA